jgi:hypothetical protein
MPRNHLKRAQQLVKAFCASRSIPYYETGVVRSYREILQSLHEVGASLSARKSG